ncbi:bifunctional protein-serine/threonine kinase/phosphatase [Shewanella canadensis]|uniref:Bifunctional protein-serine/threonine kinase/phosphatase n=1 Tax=Shewanella canadensis TaxID=271096 RepID=A0A3S0J4U0_9GAMM|nr:bifunctional protein-serine/threonine kinase/phosphatase [Shewanella canadensis]RTR37966.1 bifunctional protein-serine/threonine kinase/phosphatase [Shewanella canadensis]
MTKSNRLNINLASHSEKGLKEINEDAVGFFAPVEDRLLEGKGIILAVADGVSSAEAGKDASETAVKRFIDDYYPTPDTWSVKHSGQKLLSSINITLFKRSHEFASEEKGYLTTFTGLVIKSRTCHLFHVGDSRAYLYRNNELKQLTRDHVASIATGRSFLARAVGMDNCLQIDYSTVDLEDNDLLLATSDGIHDFVDSDKLIEILSLKMSEQEKIDLLAKTAFDNGSDDNISGVIAQVNQLPNESLNDYNSKLLRLPFPPPLDPGVKLDGYKVIKELFASSRSQLYLVEDTDTGFQMVMKTPSITFQEDTGYIDRFIQEEWIGKRISSEYVVRIIEQERPRTCLYYLMEYVHGVSMDKWMKQNHFPKPKLAISIIEKIAKGLAEFHKMETIHQDLKPANILIDKDNNIKIVDFGSVFVAGLAEVFIPLEHEGALGTATYSDPKYLLGKNTGIQGDLYALATISYELFCGKLPYGEKIEECQTAFEYDRLRYIPANEVNPVIPMWFDRTLQRGVAFDLEERYENIDEFLTDLRHPNPIYLRDDPKVTKNKSQVLFWQLLSGFWILMLILVIAMFKQG